MDSLAAGLAVKAEAQVVGFKSRAPLRQDLAAGTLRGRKGRKFDFRGVDGAFERATDKGPAATVRCVIIEYVPVVDSISYSVIPTLKFVAWVNPLPWVTTPSWLKPKIISLAAVVVSCN